MRGVGGFWDSGYVRLLDEPPNGDLRRALSVPVSNRLKTLVLQHRPTRQRTIRGEQVVVLAGVLEHRFLRQKRVVLGLMRKQGRFVGQMRHRLVEQLRREVAHANMSRLSCFLHLHKRIQRTPQRIHIAIEMRRPVDEQQVHVVGAQRAQALLGGALHISGCEVGVPHLRRQKDVLACHRGFGDAGADLGFVLIHLRSVDVAVAHREGMRHALAAGVAGNLVRTQSQRRDLASVDGGRGVSHKRLNL